MELSAHDWGRIAQGFLMGITLSIIVAIVKNEIAEFMEGK